jgi:hypothetical protein
MAQIFSFPRREIENSLTEMFKLQETPPMQDFLNNPDLFRSIQNEVGVAVDYVVKNAGKFLDMALQKPSESRGDILTQRRNSRKATGILKDPCAALHAQLCTDKEFCDRLASFAEKGDPENNKDPEIVGQFSEIFAMVNRKSKFKLLSENRVSVLRGVLSKLHIIGYRSLLVTFLVECRQALYEPDKEDFRSFLTVFARTDNTPDKPFYIFEVLRSFVTDSGEEQLGIFLVPSFIESLLKMVIDIKNPSEKKLLAFKGFDMIAAIINCPYDTSVSDNVNRDREIRKIVEKYGRVFFERTESKKKELEKEMVSERQKIPPPEYGDIQNLEYMSLPVFCLEGVKRLMPYFFDAENQWGFERCSWFNVQYIRALDRLSPDEFDEFANSDLVKKLLELNLDKRVEHYTALVVALKIIEPERPFKCFRGTDDLLNDQKWMDFVVKVLKFKDAIQKDITSGKEAADS